MTIGVSTSSTWPGHLGQTMPHPRRGAEPPKVQCTDVALPEAQSEVLGAGGPTPGMWYLLTCPNQTSSPRIEHLVWVPTLANTAPPKSPVGADPGSLAAQAEGSIVLPAPSIQLSPANFSVVNLPSWLAIDPTLWHPFKATATAGGVTVSALATPQHVIWNMGDGGTIQCDGPGNSFNSEIPDTTQRPSCAYTYKASSDGQPSSDGNPNNGAFQLEQHTWATEAGERRSRVEVTADEVGPSLRFATAEVSRTERRTPDHAESSGSSDLNGEAEAARVDA